MALGWTVDVDHVLDESYVQIAKIREHVHHLREPDNSLLYTNSIPWNRLVDLVMFLRTAHQAQKGSFMKPR